jgi:acetylornithine deacetylase/succinyl-diaminopimelate desuccinylase-like protein
MAATADEEAGSHLGAHWLWRHRRDLVDAEYALNEGGGSGLEINGKVYYTVQTAEKGSARFKLRATGEPGHGSVPHENNAIVRLGELLSRVRGKQPPVHFTATLRGYIEGLASAQEPEVAQALRAVLADEASAGKAIERLSIDELLKLELHAMARNTVAPTMLQAGSQINVIPSEALAYVDARILPGQTLESFLQELRAIFGPDCEIEFVDPSIALEADPASPLFEVIKDVLRVRRAHPAHRRNRRQARQPARHQSLRLRARTLQRHERLERRAWSQRADQRQSHAMGHARAIRGGGAVRGKEINHVTGSPTSIPSISRR